MAYRHSDPAKDWDAYCDDNPEDPDVADIDTNNYISTCCGCGMIDTSKKNVFICEECGLFAKIDEEKTIDNWLEILDSQLTDAKYDL